MERNDFLKKGLTGTGMFAATAAVGNVLKNDIDELKELDVMGISQLPNAGEEKTASTVLHKSNTRGYANHGWLESKHSFSFANYYNPDRMHFGVLRVLNDDRVDPAKGFGRHPHDNMEIISIPLEGDLEHKDSMDNLAVIRKGDIQVMSAGTGIFHSEYNKNTDQEARFLQIWVFPKKKNVEPRYDQVSLNLTDRHNKLQQVVSPNRDGEGVWINQDAWFHMGVFDKEYAFSYQLKKPGNGVYVFVIKGSFTVGDQQLEERDGLGIWDTSRLTLGSVTQDAEILLMEVPMTMA